MTAILYGTPWADTLEGTLDNEIIYGNDGADRLLGEAGNDALYGGRGRDTLDGGDGSDTLLGGEGDDVLIYDPADLLLRGNEGSDLLVAGPLISYGKISLANYPDIENLAAAGSNMTLQGGAGDNILIGNNHGDSIDGGPGNDFLYGAGSLATLNGGAGNDVIVYQPDNQPDNVWGGAGNDELDAGWTTGGAAIALTDYSHNDIEIVIGGYGADTILGNGLANTLIGGGGDDIISGLAGNDLLYGGRGNDTLDGGSGSDTLAGGQGADVYLWGAGSGNDMITGSVLNGQDTLRLAAGISLADVKFTAVGNDMVLSLRSSGLTDKLTIKDWTKSSACPIGQLIADTESATLADGFWRAFFLGSDADADDTLYGLEGNHVITGLANNDVILGRGSADTLYGGSGNDTILYYSGLAKVDGGDGNDALSAETAAAGVMINLSAGSVCSGVEKVAGSRFNDTLSGWLGGNDTLSGGGGNDWLISSAGSDTFVFAAGDGNDTLRNIDDSDWICFADGWTSESLYAYKTSGNELVIACADSADILTIEDYDFSSGVFPHFAQADGTEILLADIGSGQYSFGGLDHNFATINNDNIFAANDNGVLLHGLAGNDTLTGGGGDDTLYGDYGSDTLFGRDGNDTLYGGKGNDYLSAGSGNNLLYGEQGSDTLAAGSGSDTLVGGSNDDCYLLQENCGQALIGADSNDRLAIREGEKSFIGYTFNYFFINTTDEADHCPEAALADNDLWLDFSLYGTAVLKDYAGNSDAQLQSIQIWNESGAVASFNGLLGIGTQENDSRHLSDANDNMFFGMDGNDSIVGGNKQNYLVGGAGNDTLSGGAASSNNILLGGDGNDSISGGGMFDILVGGEGDDTLLGGSKGFDVYRFAGGWGRDVIVDTVATGTGTNCIDFTDLRRSDIQIAASGSSLTLSYGDDVLQITGGYAGYAIRFGIAENEINKYLVAADGTLTPFTSA